MNPYRYSLSLRLTHPVLSADEIQKKLSLESRVSRTVGEARKAPAGNLLGGLNHETYCSFRLAEGNDDDVSLSHQLLAWTTELSKHKSFFKNFLDTEGKAEYFIGLFMQGNSGVTITAEDMRRIQDLGIDLAFDIYPP